jgi:hypothetical protein
MYKTIKRKRKLKRAHTLKGGSVLGDASGETGPVAWVQILGILGLFGAGIYYTKVSV